MSHFSNDIPVTVDPADYYRIVRGQLEHEDNLITNRLSWLIASQSFLFTAYAIIANGVIPVAPGSAPISTDPRHTLLLLIPAVASLTSLLIMLAIFGGIFAMRSLRQLYDRHHIPAPASPLPPLQGYRATRFLGLAAPVLLPILFLAVWAYLVMQRLF